MKTNNFIVAGLIGSIIHFFLGWIVYGILLMNVMQSHTNQNTFRKDDEMIFWSIILGSISFGFLLCYILENSKVSGLKNRTTLSVVVGLLMAAYVNFSSFGTSTVYIDIIGVLSDTFAGGLVAGFTGWGISLYLDKSANIK